MQWKQMDWPVLADPFNELGIKVVPITLLIDRHGIIRYKNPKDKDLATFLESEYQDDAKPSAAKSTPPGYAEFVKGVEYRQRFDSPEREPGDFENAIDQWSKALALDPDQYIWRRRIQQYGPRLDKPYSFYDWVAEARKDIIARGETPIKLTAEPGGSEFAYPEKNSATAAPRKHPDPEGKVSRDSTPLVTLQPTIVPSTKGNGEAVRVHLRMTPNAAREVHWTDEAGPPEFFLEPGSDSYVYDFQAPPAVGDGERVIEFEIRPAKGKQLPEEIRGAVFYFICEDVGGVCQYLRNDIVFPLR